MFYFSYGSNMSSPRLRHRVRSARPVSTALLSGHRLKFHKRGRDGSAKCDVEHTQDPADIVHGVVFQMLSSEKAILDRFEGLGNGYEEKQVTLVLPDTRLLEAVTYFATHIDASLIPYHWYKEHVLRGAREHRLPPHYIAAIESVESVDDPDPGKHSRELSIYV